MVEEVVAKRKLCHKALWKYKSAEDKYTLDVAKKDVYKNSLLLFRVNLAGGTASGLLDRWLEREEMSSVGAV